MYRGEDESMSFILSTGLGTRGNIMAVIILNVSDCGMNVNDSILPDREGEFMNIWWLLVSLSNTTQLYTAICQYNVHTIISSTRVEYFRFGNPKYCIIGVASLCSAYRLEKYLRIGPLFFCLGKASHPWKCFQFTYFNNCSSALWYLFFFCSDVIHKTRRFHVRLFFHIKFHVSYVSIEVFRPNSNG